MLPGNPQSHRRHAQGGWLIFVPVCKNQWQYASYFGNNGQLRAKHVKNCNDQNPYTSNDILGFINGASGSLDRLGADSTRIVGKSMTTNFVELLATQQSHRMLVVEMSIQPIMHGAKLVEI